MATPLLLTAPVTITLMPQAVQTIVQGLNELPYKFAAPIIDDIVAQCQAQVEKKDDVVTDPHKTQGETNEPAS